MNEMLILTAVVIVICIILNKISNRLGIPMLLGFIVLGMVFGSDGILKIQFDNFAFADHICSTALIFIMFYGGFGTNWNEAKPIAVKAVGLSTLGVVLTAGFVGLFCHYVLKISFLESMLIGSLLASTDAASVFSILRSKRLNLKYNTASILEIESGSNDPAAYMLTVIVMTLIKGQASGGQIAYMLFSQIVYGIGIGVVIALVASQILKRFKFTTSGFDTIFVVAVAVFSYALPTYVGGNGYLSAYIVGIILGNSKIRNKKTLVPFFDGINGLMQMLIFFLFIFDNKYYDDIYDGVVYMMLIALSFAGLENLMYAFSESTVSSSISLALMRDVTTIPLHVICGIVIGYFVSLGTFSKDKTKKIINFLMALLLSSFIHGTFNNIMELLGSIGQTSALVAILLEVLPLTLIMIGLFAIAIIFSKRTMYLNKIYLSNGTYDDKHKYLMTYDEYLISNDRKKRVKLYNKTNFKGNKNDNDVEVLKEDL